LTMIRNFIPSCLLLVLPMLAAVSLRGELFVLMLPLLFYMGAGFLHRPAEIKFEISRRIDSDRIIHGQTVVIRLRITNRGPKLEELLLEDLLPSRLELTAGSNVLLTTLGPGETAEWNYTIRTDRGKYTFGLFRAIIGSHLGLFKKRLLFKLKTVLEVTPLSLKLKNVVTPGPVCFCVRSYLLYIYGQFNRVDGDSDDRFIVRLGPGRLSSSDKRH